MSENLIQQRYGKARSKKLDRVIAISLGATALVLFLGWAIWFTAEDSERVTTRDVGYQIIDEYSATVKFEVTRQLGQTVTCDIQVLNQSYAVVGWKKLIIEPSGSRSSVLETTVNTTELGVSGLVAGCR